MMTSNMTHGANTSLYRKLPYDPLRDFQHIGMFGVFGLILLVAADSPIKSFADLVTQAKAKPMRWWWGTLMLRRRFLRCY